MLKYPTCFHYLEANKSKVLLRLGGLELNSHKTVKKKNSEKGQEKKKTLPRRDA